MADLPHRVGSKVGLRVGPHPLLVRVLVTVGVLATLAASAPAQLQFEELRKRHLPVDRDPSTALAPGDVDGDGDLDLVVGADGQKRLWLNDGTGTFTDATAGRMPADGNTTKSLVLGDVDGDGDLDLVIGNYQQQDRLYLNDGSGRFTDATAGRLPVIGYWTRSLALGDVDGDGDPDLRALSRDTYGSTTSTRPWHFPLSMLVDDLRRVQEAARTASMRAYYLRR